MSNLGGEAVKTAKLVIENESVEISVYETGQLRLGFVVIWFKFSVWVGLETVYVMSI